MTVKEACFEIRAISYNMSLEYMEGYCWTSERNAIIEDLQETIRLFNDIIGKLNESNA